MPSVSVAISRFVDEHFPGFVEFVLVDALGARHTFVDKVPIVTEAALQSGSTYPHPGTLPCEIVGEFCDASGRLLVQVSTARPCGVESTAGAYTFSVLAAQVQR